MHGVFLCRASQRSNPLSQFLAERCAEFVDDTTPHNRDAVSGTQTHLSNSTTL